MALVRSCGWPPLLPWLTFLLLQSVGEGDARPSVLDTCPQAKQGGECWPVGFLPPP